MRFNINYKVRVKLTDEGRRIHRENYDRLFPVKSLKVPNYRPPKEDAEGWSTWQLWELMFEFGANCYNGAKVPFETEIDIVLNGDVIQLQSLLHINELVVAAEQDCMDEETEEGKNKALDDEPVAAASGFFGGVDNSVMTFGMIRRARKAIDGLLGAQRV